MSLLMQALKKAERARQSGLQQEDLPDAGHEFGEETLPNDTVAPTHHAPDGPAARAPVSSGSGLELSLEPLDQGPAPGGSPFPPPPSPPPPSSSRMPPIMPPIEPAVEATHSAVPPQARHERARMQADTGEIPVTDARAVPRPAGAGTENRRAPGAPERRAVPRTGPPRADAASGIDLPRLRVAGLAGVLLILTGTFGYLYWQAVNGPGPGASLPMVPMPPPSATGATSAGGDGGIIVAPSGAPFGTLGAPAPEPAAAQPPPEYATPPVQAAPDRAAPDNAAPPALRAVQRNARAAAPAGPTPAQLAAIEDPEIRREAMRDAMERADRMARMQASDAGQEAPDGGAPGTPASPEGTARSDVQIARGTSSPTISPAVRAGYASFGAGDLAAAQRQYGAALRDDPNNRDALLGSAAIATRERRDDEAASLYLRLLAINPRDADAIAGLTALRPGDGDRAEVRLKGVLRDNPEAAPVHFALGNLYARQRRWQEAQQAYFHAWSAAPGNADYAFNLAVGLDRLNQGRLAREYYQRALTLGASAAVAFDRAAVQRRLLELETAGRSPVPAAVPARAPVPAPVADPSPPAATVQAPEPAPLPAAVGN